MTAITVERLHDALERSARAAERTLWPQTPDVAALLTGALELRDADVLPSGAEHADVQVWWQFVAAVSASRVLAADDQADPLILTGAQLRAWWKTPEIVRLRRAAGLHRRALDVDTRAAATGAWVPDARQALTVCAQPPAVMPPATYAHALRGAQEQAGPDPLADLAAELAAICLAAALGVPGARARARRAQRRAQDALRALG